MIVFFAGLLIGIAIGIAGRDKLVALFVKAEAEVPVVEAKVESIVSKATAKKGS